MAFNNAHTEMRFNNLDDMHMSQHKYPPLGSTSYNQEYHRHETGNSARHQTSKFGCCTCCSQQCLIGLGIGLAIGILLVIIIAVPVGVTKKPSLGTISSTPNWIGTFLVDNACDTSTCCCLSNEAKLFKAGDNQIQITGSLAGACSGLSTTISLTAPMPTGFQAYLNLFGQNYRFQLGQDSSYIYAVNTNSPYCSVSGLRTSYNTGNMESMNLGLLMFILSFTVGIMT